MMFKIKEPGKGFSLSAHVYDPTLGKEVISFWHFPTHEVQTCFQELIFISSIEKNTQTYHNW